MKYPLALLILAVIPPPACLGQTTGREVKRKPPPGMMEVIIPLPKPMYVGPNVQLDLPNLEHTYPRRADSVFFAPIGTTNIALGKTVTSSDAQPVVGEFQLITDGAADDSNEDYVELAPGRQWVQIDLAAVHRIEKIALWHHHKLFGVYHDVIVQVSDDPEFKANVITLFNNDHDNSSGLGEGGDPAYVETNHGRVIDGKGARARHVRLWSRGNTNNDMNHYCEVQVYGSPVK